MPDNRSEQLRRRKIERLIEAIYNETNLTRRKSFIATLAEEEAKPDARAGVDESARRAIIYRLIELIYRETDPHSRGVLVAILAAEEADDGAAAAPRRRHSH